MLNLDEDGQSELLRLKYLVADFRLTLAMRKFRDALAHEAKYRPNQPRVPAGSSDGGQWTRDGGIAPAADSGAGVGEDGLLQPAFFQGYAAEKAAEAALYLYLYLAQRNSPDATAALEFNSQEFLPGASSDDPALRVGSLTREEVDKACPRHALVQELTNEAASIVRSDGNYRNAREYGTRVHFNLEQAITANGDPNLRAEVSLIKSDEATRGKPGSVRIDVFERVGDGNVCIYDIKTGERGLSPARMAEIAKNAHKLYGDTRRLVIIEVRPR